jgi:TPP-dependent pyruvate/acetoin dehydrogenase alpha subunit
VDEATDFAERSPLPDPSTLHRHVYAEPAALADLGLQRAA